MNEHPEHTSLMKWVRQQGQYYWLNRRSLKSTLNRRNGGLVELMYQDGQAQIERVTHGPFQVVPLHRHPHVDSYEFPLWGSGEIWINQRKYFLDDRRTRWRPLFISRKTWHGGCGKERGGAFLSVQWWDGEEPDGSVLEDWIAK